MPIVDMDKFLDGPRYPEAGQWWVDTSTGKYHRIYMVLKKKDPQNPRIRWRRQYSSKKYDSTCTFAHFAKTHRFHSYMEP